MTGAGLETIAALAPELAAGRVSPVHLVEALLRRAERLEPILRAYVRLDPASALEAAERAGREIAAGAYRGPLHGVPIAVKDNLPVSGWPTTNGSPLMAAYVAGHEAGVVERLRAAGAVIVGTTRLHEWAMGGTCTYEPGGPVRNPWDPDRVPGGSSGGSAAAVAAGLAYGAIGTDGAGSIRTPAAYCGVVGLKPTRGLVTRFGIVPPTSSPLDHVGPLARSVADARLILEATAGYDPRDPTSRRPPDELPRGLPDRRPRIGAVRSDVLREVRPEVGAAVADVVDSLARLGCDAVEVEVPSLGLAGLVWAGVLSEAQELLLPLAVDHPDGFANPDLRYRILAAEFVRAADVRRARQLATRLRGEIWAALDDVDALLLPTTTTPAFPIGAERVAVGSGELVDLRRPGGQARVTTRLTLPFNVAGLPALSIPAPALVDGLPVGVQLVGRPWADEWLLELAGTLEAAGAAYRPPAGVARIETPSV
ncbi:MAG TPA: amidase [Candidatus Limnocylindrales bacterium]|nr:amidase [Candidatus Limnocylindrales bacterium]